MDLGNTALLGLPARRPRARSGARCCRHPDPRRRARSKKLEREFPNAEARPADFLTGERLDDAGGGIDTVFYLAGAPYTHFEQHPS